jgi:hypothetical protein
MGFGRVASLRLGVLIVACALLLSGCDQVSPPPGGSSGDGLDLSKVEAAWGPERSMFRTGAQQTEPALNAIEDSPRWGDERSFLRLREVGTSDWHDEGDVPVKPGQTYEGRILFHNAAKAGSSSAVSRGTRARVSMPATVVGRGQVSVILSSGNATVPEVWRSLVVTSPVAQSVALRYTEHPRLSVAGRADIELPSDLFTTRGALIGCGGATGVFAPDCQGEVSLGFVVDQPNFTITQEVSLSGADRYGYEAQFSPGDLVDIKLRYQNVGTTQQNSVVLRTTLPPKMSYLLGSTKISNSTTKGRWSPLYEDDGIAGPGLNIGSYAPGGAAFMRLTARLPPAEAVGCGLTSVTVTNSADTKNGSKSAATDLWVEKKC